MAADRNKVHAALQEAQAAPVALRVAASLVYFQVSRNLAAKNDIELDRALNDAALALAQIADVYYENDKGHLLRIQDDDSHAGTFEDGAKTFRTAAGQTYTALSMRRIDIMYALDVLEKASHALHSAEGRLASRSPEQ